MPSSEGLMLTTDSPNLFTHNCTGLRFTNFHGSTVVASLFTKFFICVCSPNTPCCTKNLQHQSTIISPDPAKKKVSIDAQLCVCSYLILEHMSQIPVPICRTNRFIKSTNTKTLLPTSIPLYHAVCKKKMFQENTEPVRPLSTYPAIFMAKNKLHVKMMQECCNWQRRIA